MGRTASSGRGQRAITCAGCRRPFVIRRGWSEAIVGEDGRLYCYSMPCEHDACARDGAGRRAA
jgi:hypothetical protein